MNPHDEVQRGRLFKAMELSYRQLEPFRNLVRGLVEEYAGSGYGSASAKPRHEILVNLLEQAVRAYTMSLVANRPRILATAKRQGLGAFANTFQVAMNNLIEEICLEQTLRRAVRDAFFCVGFVKMHMADSIPVMVEEGVWMDPGIPFASNVPLENFVYDMTATEWQKVKFSADSYRIPFDDLKMDIFDQKVVANLMPTSKAAAGHSEDRLEMISKGYETDSDEVVPMIDLMDVWLPDTDTIFTFAMDQKTRFFGQYGPLAELEWKGHEFGPHKRLSFGDVPENIMASGPASQLAGLSRLANSVLRKQGRQARRQKDVTVYTPAGAESARAVVNAGDGDAVQAESPDEVRTLKMGGVDAGNQAFFVELMDLFDRAAGNLPAILGLGSQAETLGQEQMIQASTNQMLAHMQYDVADFTRSVVRDLGYLLWNDKVKTIPGRFDIRGASGYSVDATWRPDVREGDLIDYDLDIDVYSMPYRSPVQRLNAINTFLTNVYTPMLQVLPPEGLQKLTSMYAELLNEPRLLELFDSPMPMPTTEEGGGKPAQTSREYIRRSVPSQGTPQGKAMVKQQAWLGRASSQAGAQTQGG